ncbi:hypothetical protein H0H92_006123 [Tricholoma furcatifolium]|nr:hypothetical protein H0H92_006123 [Tricholoma furcatifolium]
MRFSTAVFFAAAAFFTGIGVAQAMPRRDTSGSLSARGSSSAAATKRGLFADDNVVPRAVDEAPISARSLDEMLETRDYMSKRFDFVEKNVLAAREDTCPICMDKIRAPDKLYSFCSNSPTHEACGHCLTDMLQRLMINCPMCRGQMHADHFKARVCKERTPPPGQGQGQSHSGGSGNGH